MKEPTLKNKIDEFKPMFKSWNEVSQKVSMKYGMNSLGEMAFWHDESWSLYLHDIYTTSHSRKLSWRGWLTALSNTYMTLPFLPAASRNPGHTGCHGAGWLPALSNTRNDYAFLTSSKTPGRKTTIMSQSLLWWWKMYYTFMCKQRHGTNAQGKKRADMILALCAARQANLCLQAFHHDKF